MRDDTPERAADPLSEFEQRVLQEIELGLLAPRSMRPTSDEVSRALQIEALLVAVLGLAWGTASVLIGLERADGVGLALVVFGLAVFLWSVRVALTYRLGLRRRHERAVRSRTGDKA